MREERGGRNQGGVRQLENQAKPEGWRDKMMLRMYNPWTKVELGFGKTEVAPGNKNQPLEGWRSQAEPQDWRTWWSQWTEKAVVGQGNLIKLHRSQWRRKVQRTVWRVWSRDVHKSLSWSPSQV